MNATAASPHLIWTHATSVVAIAIHICLLLQIMKPKSAAALVVILIVAAPPVLISVVAAFLNRTDAPRTFALSFSAVYLTLGAWAYYDAIYIHPDPQNGLVFIVVPILGIVATAIGAAVVFLVFRGNPTSGTKKHDA